MSHAETALLAIRRVTLMRGLRQAAYSMVSVVLAVALTRRGLTPPAIGLLVTAALAGNFVATLLIGRWADAWGRRRTLAVLALLMALTGVVYGLARWLPLLFVAAFAGTLGTSASETAPFLPIEQVIISQSATPEQRVVAFARYNLVASLAGALGALLAGAPDLLAQRGVGLDAGLLLIFLLYALAALAVLALALRLPGTVEAPGNTPGLSRPGHAPDPGLQEAPGDTPGLERPGHAPDPGLQNASGMRRSGALHGQGTLSGASRRIIVRLAALFSMDAFAGGLIGQTLLALFFRLRFGADLASLGALFFGANLLAALSFLAAPTLARRFGLLNTMVFTHLPSNVLLLLVPLMPVFPLAAAVLWLRQSLSQLDVPTRQAYTMALVAPQERTAAASITSLARSAGTAVSPVAAGALLAGPLVALGLPLLLAGSLKATYDLVVWRIFRRVPVPPT